MISAWDLNALGILDDAERSRDASTEDEPEHLRWHESSAGHGLVHKPRFLYSCIVLAVGAVEDQAEGVACAVRADEVILEPCVVLEAVCRLRRTVCICADIIMYLHEGCDRFSRTWLDLLRPVLFQFSGALVERLDPFVTCPVVQAEPAGVIRHTANIRGQVLCVARMESQPTGSRT
jgi:hypothetical protein